jgi:hypothetical protein
MSRSVAENPIKDCHVRSATSINVTNVPSKPESRGFSRNQPDRSRQILRYPIPDFSKVQPKVDTRRSPKIGGENKKVSGAVTCSVVRMEARNLPRSFNFCPLCPCASPLRLHPRYSLSKA